jgi:hypothetical protein
MKKAFLVVMPKKPERRSVVVVVVVVIGFEKSFCFGGRDVGELSWRVMWLKSREFEFARGSAILMSDHHYCAQVTIGSD